MDTYLAIFHYDIIIGNGYVPQSTPRLVFARSVEEAREKARKYWDETFKGKENVVALDDLEITSPIR